MVHPVQSPPIIDTSAGGSQHPQLIRQRRTVNAPPGLWPLIIGVALAGFALGYFAGREHVAWETRRAASEVQRATTDMMRSFRGR